MSRYTIEGETLTGIANAVRSITGKEALMTPAQIQEEIEGTATDMQSDINDIKSALNSKLDEPETAGTSGQVLTSDGQGGQSWENPSGGSVNDVQVNGTSVLSNGVANIPTAEGSNNYGVVRIDPNYGIGSYNGYLIINGATSQNIKSGSNTTKAVSAHRQHESTFYGLTKAAGVDMKNSDNAVGTYTDEAKAAIKSMIGVPTMQEIISAVHDSYASAEEVSF